MSDALQAPVPGTLRVLADGAAAVARWTGLEDALNRLLDLAVEAASATRGAILVQDPDQAELDGGAVRGYDVSLTGVVEAAGGEDAFVEAAERPAGTIDKPLEGNTALVTLLPLVSSHEGIDRIVGMLVIERQGAPLDTEGQTLLVAIADLVAAAVDRSQARSFAQERADWVERLASSDPLTGLANRHLLRRALEHELARARRQVTEVSLVVFDVDAFRSVNDGSGREAGDRVLQGVAVAIAGAVRNVDTVARLGGDEFAVVAPGAGGIVVARRIMGAIGRLSEVLDRTVSVSAGVARFPAHGSTADELLEAAHTANEAAKVAESGGPVEAPSAPSA